jgi:antirestriction protein ArdC
MSIQVKTKAQRDKLKQDVTASIIKMLDRGTNPWKKPWAGGGMVMAHNGQTNKLYRGINSLWLPSVAVDKGYETNQWATYKQWGEVHAKILRKQGKKIEQRGYGRNKYLWNVTDECKVGVINQGEKATPVLFYKPLRITEEDDNGDKTEKVIPLLKTFAVFNRDQTLLPGLSKPKKGKGLGDMTEAEKTLMGFIEDHEVDLRYGGDRAAFNYRDDFIRMPKRDNFKTTQGHLATLAHEFVHWTGFRTRLNRDIENKRGDFDYAREELVAETGSAMLCAMLGISYDALENHASYIATWATRLREKDGHEYLFRATSAAQKAVDYILKTDFTKEAGK